MSELWLGLLFSIPVGIAVNLVSPAVARSLEKRSEKTALRREAERTQFLKDAEVLARDQGAYYTYLLTAVLRTTYIGALFALAGGALAAIGQGMNAVGGLYDFSSFFFLGAQIAALLAAILILTIARNALAMIKEIRRLRTKISGA